MRLRLLMVIILSLGIGFALPCRAQLSEEESINEDHLPKLSELAEAQYISGILFGGFNGVGQQAELPYVLKLALLDEWYTYWRTPGDGGLAPTLDWSSSINVKDVVFGWPAPTRFEQDRLYSFGYKGVAEFPVTVIPQEIGKGVALNLDMSLVVCHKICVPQTLHIHHEIPAGDAVQSPYYNYAKEVATQIPAAHTQSKDIRLDTAILAKDALVITAYAKDGFDGADMFVESGEVVMTAPPMIEADGQDPHKAVFKITAPPGTDLTQVLFGKGANVTLVTRTQTIEKEFSF